jgi:hypothetical protein
LPEYWSLDQTLVSVTGGEACGWEGSPGRTVNWPLRTRRVGNQAQFVYGDVTDELEMAGILEREAFAVSGSTAAAQPCRGEVRGYVLESTAAGRFAPDDEALTARHVLTYRFAGGQVITFTFDWSATRRR